MPRESGSSSEELGILLTGTTGLLGGELLRRVLEAWPSATAYCLIRARGADHLERRRQELIARLELGPQAQGVMRLVRAIRARTELPVATLDERYTSLDARSALSEAGIRASDQRGKVDKVAAAILLQAFLDGRRPDP